jgi:hypothetical protein
LNEWRGGLFQPIKKVILLMRTKRSLSTKTKGLTL